MSDMDDIMEEFASESDVNAALEDKYAGEFIEEESINDLLKDYPQPQREIDLHMKTGDEAIAEIHHFIDSSLLQNIRTVRIITGKGLHSAGQKSVLPALTEQKLSDFRKKGMIVSFKREKNGGSFVVYLR